MKIFISELIKQKEQFISGISEKFHISLGGAKDFLKLAIIDWAKTNYSIQISDNILTGTTEFIQELEKEVSSWTVDDFDDEDLLVIGYCKNIR